MVEVYSLMDKFYIFLYPTLFFPNGVVVIKSEFLVFFFGGNYTKLIAKLIQCKTNNYNYFCYSFCNLYC